MAWPRPRPASPQLRRSFVSVQLEIDPRAEMGRSRPPDGERKAACAGQWDNVPAILAAAAECAASDVLLISGLPPIVHCKGIWRPLPGEPLSAAGIADYLAQMMTEEQGESFERQRDLD